MFSFLRRIRGALGMGLTWALGWAPIGALFGFALEIGFGLPVGSITWVWATVLTIMGFVGGSLFSVVLRIAEGRRRFDELSLPRFAVWGAVGGAVLGVLSIALTVVGASFVTVGARELVMVGVPALLGALSAAGTLSLARMADDRELLAASDEVADVGLSASEAKKLLRD